MEITEEKLRQWEDQLSNGLIVERNSLDFKQEWGNLSPKKSLALLELGKEISSLANTFGSEDSHLIFGI